MPTSPARPAASTPAAQTPAARPPGPPRASDVAGLEEWLRGLQGCPPVTRTARLLCRSDAHVDDVGDWWYVEADPGAGVARHRCVACGQARWLMDSEARWTWPRPWACGCGQGQVEAVLGMATDSDDHGRETVRWAALGVRCVHCGLLSGLTDVHVPGLSPAALLEQA